MSQNHISHIGTVKHQDDEFVYVAIESKAACSGCKSKHFCGIDVDKEKILKIPKKNKIFNTDEQVEITISQSMGTLAVVFAYVIPFLLIILLLFLFDALQVPEVISGVAVLLSLGIYYLVLYLFRNKLNKKFNFTISKI